MKSEVIVIDRNGTYWSMDTKGKFQVLYQKRNINRKQKIKKLYDC